MSPLPAPVSVEEYLGTVYHPDCDYVDGVVLERNEGEKTHEKIQKWLLLFLEARATELGIFVLQEVRIRVSSTRFRVPDLCVVAGSEPDEEVFTRPPFFASKFSRRKTV